MEGNIAEDPPTALTLASGDSKPVDVKSMPLMSFFDAAMPMGGATAPRADMGEGVNTEDAVVEEDAEGEDDS